MEEIMGGTRPPAIVHATEKRKEEEKTQLMLRPFLGGRGGMPYLVSGNEKKRAKMFNIFDAKKDFENCNGWSATVNRKNWQTMEGSNVGIFMVNLTKGSMMGPHWNPRATEVALVLQGRGMVRVVCPSTAAAETECKNVRFMVKEGDVFVVPRFHPMAQISFNNDSLVFMGFSTSKSRNYPQFLAGKSSVLRTLDEGIVSLGFNVSNNTMHRILSSQEESIILDCTSCAEEEQRIMMEEEEERRREEEEVRKRKEEEEEREREEEEKKRQEEEERRREEEEKERKAREEEEERREEEEKKRQEEEEARRQEEERERKEKEEEEKREEEEEARREEEERERKQREEERERKEREEERDTEQREQEAEQRRREERRRREEAARREEEEAKMEEEERQRGRPREDEEQSWPETM